MATYEENDTLEYFRNKYPEKVQKFGEMIENTKTTRPVEEINIPVDFNAVRDERKHQRWAERNARNGAVKNRQLVFRDLLKRIAISSLVVLLGTGGMFVASKLNNKVVVDKPDIETESNTNTEVDTNQTPIDREREEELSNYKSYCEVRSIGDKEYLVVPEEKAVELAEFALEKLSIELSNSGSDYVIPEYFTPELFASLAGNTSMGLVESVDGLTIGEDEFSFGGKGVGYFQINSNTLADINSFAGKNLGERYINSDLGNPYTSTEIKIIQWLEMNNSESFQGLTDEQKIMASLIAENQDMSAVYNYIKTGELGESEQFCRDVINDMQRLSNNKSSDYIMSD